jgi:hypothetical protein
MRAFYFPLLGGETVLEPFPLLGQHAVQWFEAHASDGTQQESKVQPVYEHRCR